MTYEMLNFTDSDMVTEIFFFLKPVATSIQIAITVYLEPKKKNLFKTTLWSF